VLHPSFDPEVAGRRQQEFEAAKSGYEVGELQRKWQAEDRAIAEAADYRSRQVDELHARVAQLERALGPDGRSLVDALAPGLADAVGKVVGTQRRELDAKIAEIENRQLRFMGVHEAGRAYKANSLTIKKGGLWIALVDTVTPPGTSADWQLAVKSGEAGKLPGIA
jgi:hypothetical protein